MCKTTAIFSSFKALIYVIIFLNPGGGGSPRPLYQTLLSVNLVSQAICIFPHGAHAQGKGRGKGRNNTSGKMCKVFIPSAGMLAEPIKFEHSK